MAKRLLNSQPRFEDSDATDNRKHGASSLNQPHIVASDRTRLRTLPSTAHCFTVAGVSLPDGGIRREPTRPESLRDATFNERFDSQTLIYDAIRCSDGAVRIVSPALLNLTPLITSGSFHAGPSGEALPFRLRQLDRQTQIIVKGVPEGATLEFRSELGVVPIAISESALDLFAGERVVFTLSRNNRLEWIQDWARYYRDVHGATAILIFDNASTAYDSQALLKAMAAVGGLSKVVVVDWPFKHGPPGHGMKRYWDSNFSQLGAFEVARWRFLNAARSVLNCDIDELVVSMSGGSIFDAAESSRSGVVAFYGDWVFGLNGLTPVPPEGEPIRFRDFAHVLASQRVWKNRIWPTYPMRCRAKWATVPSRCPDAAQWHIHTVNGWWPARIVSRDFRFRHFREINFNWKYDRLGREDFDANRHREDPVMRTAFNRVDWAR